jgi:CGNR zinc finger
LDANTTTRSAPAGRSTAGPAVRILAEELRRGHGSLALRGNGMLFEIEFQPREQDPRFLLARAAAGFLASADPARIRRCGGTNCILFFYDATRSGTRRWCSMAACGNRMKAALHYQRRNRLTE